MATQNLASVSPMFASRELSFIAEDFGRICDLTHRRVGVSLSDHKSEMAYSRLARRLRVVNFGSFRDYLDVLEKGHLPGKWEASINALTANLTAFFRERYHSPILHEHAKAKRTSLTVWCSASSTGEESYPVVITPAKAFGPMSLSQVGVIALGVDTNVLVRARAGIYPTERVTALSPECPEKYFPCGTGKQGGYVRVRPELQAMIDFYQIDLLECDWPLQQKFDVIPCRNMMTYFDRPTQVRTFEHFIDVMKSDGLLFAGYSESFLQVTRAWSLRGKTVYEVVPELRARMGAR